MALSDWRAMTLARLQYWLNKTIAVIRKEKTHYAISSTAAATAVKVASSTGYVLVNGAKAIVKFQYKNTAENPQLNIENTGARPICFRGEPVSSRLLEANREYLFVFDGTVYNLVGQENGDDVAELSDSLTNVINGTSPVALADNFTSENAQQSAQEFILRTSGGNASISDGDAWVSLIMGNRVHNGYIPEDIQMTVTPAQREHAQDMVISAEIDKSVFRTAVSETSGTITFIYNGTSEAWNITPLTYGITVSGSPVDGDTITVTYVLEDRGTIVVATPTAMKSTGWNLFNSTLGYAYVTKYSEEYGFKIGGSYSSLSFSETPGGATVPISVVDSFFTVPSDGYVYVAGSGSNTYILNTWSDWQEGYSGSFESYSETTINIASVMSSYFPNGLLRVGDVRDEINFNSMIAISRIERLAYTPSNIAAVIASGRAYEADTNYIYVVRASEVTNPITVSAAYTASDHGNEFFVGTSVPVYAEVLYGANLKNKLERDVLTISQQTLSSGEKTQVRTNIGAASASDLSDLNSKITNKIDYPTGVSSDGINLNGCSSVKSIIDTLIDSQIRKGVGNIGPGYGAEHPLNIAIGYPNNSYYFVVFVEAISLYHYRCTALGVYNQIVGVKYIHVSDNYYASEWL